MSLRIFNTRNRTKEEFVPVDPEHIRMYVCGPTVYNLVHIGNARPAVVFDLLFRLLRSEFEQVTYARNITDIDDKIMRAAVENSETIDSLSMRYTREYEADMAAIGCQPPTIEPRATDHIPQMIGMIEALIAEITPMKRRAMFCSVSNQWPIMALCPIDLWRTCLMAPVWKSLLTKSMPAILCCGNHHALMNPAGIAPGVLVDLAGIWNARP